MVSGIGWMVVLYGMMILYMKSFACYGRSITLIMMKGWRIVVEYRFKIPIGDWSDDGHGKCEWVDIVCSHSLKAVRKAYLKAADTMEYIWPEYLCSEYEEQEVDPEDIQELIKAGFTPNNIDEDGFWRPEVEDFVHFVMWFVQRGNKRIKYKIDVIPMLPWYGNNGKKRHISFHGYGLFV
jgi:hypothetical protein